VSHRAQARGSEQILSAATRIDRSGPGQEAALRQLLTTVERLKRAV